MMASRCARLAWEMASRSSKVRDRPGVFRRFRYTRQPVKVVILGGSLGGLASALSFARRGHEVVVLERDVEPPSETRRGTPQASQSHGFLPRLHRALRERDPDVLAALLDEGVDAVPLAGRMPPGIADRGAKPGDEELVFLASRRPLFETVVRKIAAARPGVRFERGRAVQGLEIEAGPIPRVRGVRTDAGIVEADLVVDASGRNTAVPGWLRDAGADVLPEESDDCGIVYFTRFYQRRPGTPDGPLNRGFGAGGPLPYFQCVLFLGDNRTFSITIGCLADDALLKRCSDPGVFTTVARSVPLVAPWLEFADPLGGVHPMGRLRNVLRRSVAGGRPIARGIHLVADAACHTDPSFGRGVALAFDHAERLAEVVDAHPGDADAQTLAFDAATSAEIEPWYRDAVDQDRARLGFWRAAIDGEVPARPPSAVALMTILGAAQRDSSVWRGVTRYVGLLRTREDLFADAEITARVSTAYADGWKPALLVGPERPALAALLAAV